MPIRGRFNRILVMSGNGVLIGILVVLLSGCTIVRLETPARGLNLEAARQERPTEPVGAPQVSLTPHADGLGWDVRVTQVIRRHWTVEREELVQHRDLRVDLLSPVFPLIGIPFLMVGSVVCGLKGALTMDGCDVSEESLLTFMEYAALGMVLTLPETERRPRTLRPWTELDMVPVPSATVRLAWEGLDRPSQPSNRTCRFTGRSSHFSLDLPAAYTTSRTGYFVPATLVASTQIHSFCHAAVTLRSRSPPHEIGEMHPPAYS